MLKSRLLKLLFGGAIICAALGCKAGQTIDKPDTNAEPSLTAKASVKLQFRCLPPEAAFVAAHRGVSKKEGLAENSGSSLKALIDRGIMFAEVDVAGLKDGTLILYHDGVWDEKSTGKGPVAKSNWSDAEKILLHDTDGKLTADRPIRLSDALALAKDSLYLEIDFKSSANYRDVIGEIREAGMSDRVILIAYNERQAAAMSKLAPNMALSVTLKSQSDIDAHENAGVARSNMNAWLGRGPFDPIFTQKLEKNNISVLAWPNREDIQTASGPASLIVSDYAFKLDPIIGLSQSGRENYEACLSKG